MDKQIFTSVPIEDLMQSLRLIVREEIAANPSSQSRETTEYVNGEALCSFIGISKPTLIRYRKKGKIPFIEVGGVLRYDKNKVAKALELGNKKGDPKHG